MPELPEVETIARRLRPALVGRKVAYVHCSWKRTLAPRLSTARSLLIGKRFAEITRRGKYVVFRLAEAGVTTGATTDVTMLVHLRMSGRLAVAGAPSQREKHERFRVGLDGGDELRFVDARKFGRVVVTERPADVLNSLGVEPLDRSFTPQLLWDLLRSRSRILKPLLLDQSVICGIGNIYSDEALHRAGIHPCRSSRTLKMVEVERLHAGIRQALREGIASNGASIDWVYPGGSMQNRFRAYGRTGEPCSVCGTAIRRRVVGQRATHYCPNCQRAPRGLEITGA